MGAAVVEALQHLKYLYRQQRLDFAETNEPVVKEIASDVAVGRERVRELMGTGDVGNKTLEYILDAHGDRASSSMDNEHE